MKRTFIASAGLLVASAVLPVASAIVLLLPAEAFATVEWATWSGYPANTRTGTFPNAVTVTLFGVKTFPGVGSVGEGLGFTTDTLVTGMSSTDNPPYQQILSATSSGAVTGDGDDVAKIDLYGLPDDATPYFAISDLKFSLAIEFLDDQSIPLNQTAVVVTPYNVHFPIPDPENPPAIAVADMWGTLTPVAPGNTTKGKLVRDFVNHLAPDSSFYNQTGLLLLSNLPAGTVTIKLTSFGSGQGEGLNLFVGADFPVGVDVTDDQGPAGDSLLAFGTIAVGAESVKRSITVSNPGSQTRSLAITRTGLDDSVVTFTNNCGATLAPSASCKVDLVFHPAAAEATSGQVKVEADSVVAATVSVTGTGTLSKTGDANGDGSTKVTDALTVLKVSVGSLPKTASILASCDMNSDGKITINDALAVLRKSVGL